MTRENFSAPRGFMCDVCHARLDLTTRVAIDLVPRPENDAYGHGAVQSVDMSQTVTELTDPDKWRAWEESDKIAASRGWACYYGTRSQRHYCPACAQKPKSPQLERLW